MRARELYFGDAPAAERVLTELDEHGPHLAFAEWWGADYRRTKRSRSWVDVLLEGKQQRFGAEERALLEARRTARLSIFRVGAQRPRR